MSDLDNIQDKNGLSSSSSDSSAEPRHSESEQKPKMGSRSSKKDKPDRPRLPAWSTRNGLWSWILFGVGLILLVSVYSKPDFAA
ncbi:MAG: hypothetical protein EB120_11100, partial [Proteobacteria bacterium]|nr:hypothetical protein [Pseudomonadota bacterium]